MAAIVAGFDAAARDFLVATALAVSTPVLAAQAPASAPVKCTAPVFVPRSTRVLALNTTTVPSPPVAAVAPVQYHVEERADSDAA